jgi:hypothetical protein
MGEIVANHQLSIINGGLLIRRVPCVKNLAHR